MKLNRKGIAGLAVVGIIALVGVGVIAVNNGLVKKTVEVSKSTLGF